MKTRSFLPCLLALACLLGAPLGARATSLVVTNLADSGPGTLRAAIAIANTNAGDTITFATNGTITLATGLVITNDLTIAGPGPTNLVLNGNGQHYSVFALYGNTNITDNLSGLTIENGVGGHGGGILNESTLVVSNCVITNNTTLSGTAGYLGEGGGVWNNGVLTLTACMVSSNSAPNYGGGIYNLGTLTVTNCTLFGNSAASYDGGGVWNGGVLTLTACTLSENGALNGNGGGIFNSNRLTLANCTLSTNYALNGSGGGAIANLGTLTLTNCTLAENDSYCDGGGGGIYNAGGSTATLNNCTLSYNWELPQPSTQLIGGGGIENYGLLTVNNSTFTGNTAYNWGGAINNYGTNILNHCTITNNYAENGVESASGGGIKNYGFLTITDSTLSGNWLIGETLSQGGGIGNNGLLTVNNSTLSNNSSILASAGIGGGPSIDAADGGGIENKAPGILTLNNCTLSDNSASLYQGTAFPVYGGAIYNDGALTVSNCTLSGNSANSGIAAYSYGGGIYNVNGGTFALNNCTLSSNICSSTVEGSLTGAGGGIDNNTTNFVNNCTIVGNSAGAGGGIETYNVFVNNCTIVGNSAAYGGGIEFNALTSSNYEFMTNTIVAGNFAGQYTNIALDFLYIGGAANNLTNGNPQLAPLGNYGGPTQTMPPLAGSPAIDAGSDSVTNFLTTDQRGYPRLSGAHVDIGAVEAQFVAANPNNPPVLKNPVWSSAGGTNTFQYAFTNVSGADFTALTSTNLALPLADWTVLGNIPEIASGQYQFTGVVGTNDPQRFYQVVSP